jgi:hypothetical protein
LGSWCSGEGEKKQGSWALFVFLVFEGNWGLFVTFGPAFHAQAMLTMLALQAQPTLLGALFLSSVSF